MHSLEQHEGDKPEWAPKASGGTLMQLTPTTHRHGTKATDTARLGGGLIWLARCEYPATAIGYLHSPGTRHDAIWTGMG